MNKLRCDNYHLTHSLTAAIINAIPAMKSTRAISVQYQQAFAPGTRGLLRGELHSNAKENMEFDSEGMVK